MDQWNRDIKIVIRYLRLRYSSYDVDFDYLFDRSNYLYKTIKYNLNILQYDKKCIYLASVLIILKFINDENLSNREYARIFKIPVKILNLIEYEISKSIDFNVYIIIHKSKQKLSLKSILSF